MSRSSGSYEAIFTEQLHRNNLWPVRKSISGPGSDPASTATIRKELPIVAAQLGISSILDIPCGDFSWMQMVNFGLCKYIGADIVEELVSRHNQQYGSNRRKFLKLNIVNDDLPAVDMVLCRDLFVHLPYRDIVKSLNNIRKSGSKYFLTTSHLLTTKNHDILPGQWRPINLLLRPFSFPNPIKIIYEDVPEGEKNTGKTLSLWRVSDI
ncbi:MAG: class I SAM-dependent methyltransferase [Thermoproteota archaeon]|nr:class I SAM-dependent methyltransferase [Thermoproteota archaeon]